MSLHKFQLKPNNTEYFIGIIQNKEDSTNNNEFRIAMINKSDCWISKPETYSQLQINANMSDSNPIQFRQNLIHSLTNPKDKSYEIEEINTSNQNNYKETKIYHPTINLRIDYANIKLYSGPNNINYCLEKLDSTLKYKKDKNEQYKSDNINLKERYNTALELWDECTFQGKENMNRNY